MFFIIFNKALNKQKKKRKRNRKRGTKITVLQNNDSKK